MELELSRAGMSVANFVLDSIGSGFAVVHFQNGTQLVESGRMEHEPSEENRKGGATRLADLV